MLSIEEFEGWLASPSETCRLEFKEARTQFDGQRLYDYCVALANEGGGHLILGVTDAVPRKVVGTQAFRDPVDAEGKIHQKLRISVRIHEVSHADGRVLVVQVPSRPRGTAYQVDGKYLMRAGQQLVSMSEDRLRSIFLEGSPQWELETARASVSDEEVVAALDTQTMFELLGLPYPSTREEVLRRLEAERAIVRTDSTWSITRLGALLFAKQLSSFEGLSRKAPRVLVYDGAGKHAPTLREQTGVKGYAVAFEGLMQFIESQTPSNQVIGQALRREIKMYPAIAIRELVANALIHQDLNATGTSVMIEIYSDRIEVSNPGQPTVLPDRFIDGYRSRNELLADVMRRLKICEEKGSGIDKVVDSAEAFQLPAPDFLVDELRTTCVLYGHKPFYDMTREDRIRACYQHCVLRYVMRQTMSNQSLRERFGLPADKAETVSRILRDAIEDGRIKPENPEQSSRKYARYVPAWA